MTGTFSKKKGELLHRGTDETNHNQHRLTRPHTIRAIWVQLDRPGITNFYMSIRGKVVSRI